MGMNIGMKTMQRRAGSAAPTVTIRRLPASGNTALAASALIQAALGIEFFLSGLNKAADPHFIANFDRFVRANPGAQRGILAPLVQTLVLPHVGVAGPLIEISELGLGVILLFYMRVRALLAMGATIATGLAWTFGLTQLVIGHRLELRLDLVDRGDDRPQALDIAIVGGAEQPPG